MRTLAPALSTSEPSSSVEGRDRPERSRPRGRGPDGASHLISTTRHARTTPDPSRRRRTPRVARDGHQYNRALERCAKRGSAVRRCARAKARRCRVDVVPWNQPSRHPAAPAFTFPPPSTPGPSVHQDRCPLARGTLGCHVPSHPRVPRPSLCAWTSKVTERSAGPVSERPNGGGCNGWHGHCIPRDQGHSCGPGHSATTTGRCKEPGGCRIGAPPAPRARGPRCPTPGPRAQHRAVGAVAGGSRCTAPPQQSSGRPWT